MSMTSDPFLEASVGSDQIKCANSSKASNMDSDPIFEAFMDSCEAKRANFPELFDTNAEKLAAFEKYRELIRIKNVTDINEIARIVNKTTHRVQLEIQYMIYSQYILGMHIDFETNTIVPGDDPNPGRDISVSIDSKEAPDFFVCKSCGANNPATNSECEYCGSDLK